MLKGLFNAIDDILMAIATLFQYGLEILLIFVVIIIIANVFFEKKRK